MRRILHFSPGPHDFAGEIADRAVAGAWFDLNRLGGCGAGELRLKDKFPDRQAIEIGDWIAFEHTENDRWYLGRVESRQSTSPAGILFRLEGMGIELNEVFPGGFSRAADGRPPHRYAATDLFHNDPDYLAETFDSVQAADDVVRLMLQQYVASATAITYTSDAIEPPPDAATIASLKFRGEESARAAIKDLALRARNASWGVDEQGRFFFLQSRSTPLVTWREGRDLISLEESRERDNLFNRVLLTGDYVYDAPVNSEVTARGFYRWRGNYVQTASRAQYGERRIRLWVPWIRTRSDSEAFVREFFRVYAAPTTRYLIEVASTTLPRPWLGAVRLEDRHGNELVTAPAETIRVLFDHTPRFRLQLGPEDPRTLWPEPLHDERWEVAAQDAHGGNSISVPTSGLTTDNSLSSHISSDDITSESLDSDNSLNPSSLSSSDFSSGWSSDTTSSAIVSSLAESSQLESSFDSSDQPSSETNSPATSTEDPNANSSQPPMTDSTNPPIGNTSDTPPDTDSHETHWPHDSTSALSDWSSNWSW